MAKKRDYQHEYNILTTMSLEMVQIAISETSMTEDLVERVEEFEARLQRTLGLTDADVDALQ
jgi:hypothetical protein